MKSLPSSDRKSATPLGQGFALYPVAAVGSFEGNSVADFGVDVAGLEHHAAVFAVVEHFDFVVGGVCAEGSGQHEEEEGFFHGKVLFVKSIK